MLKGFFHALKLVAVLPVIKSEKNNLSFWFHRPCRPMPNLSGTDGEHRYGLITDPVCLGRYSASADSFRWAP